MKWLFLLLLAASWMNELTSVLASFRVVCYYSSLSANRDREARFFPSNIDPRLCTDFVYAFAQVNGNSVKPLGDATQQYKLYTQMVDLKKGHSYKNVFLSVTNWKWKAENYERLASFIVDFLRLHKFDGLDISSELPRKDEIQYYSQCIHTIRQTFEREALQKSVPRLLLTSRLTRVWESLDNYNVSTINTNLDWINLMTFDFHQKSQSPNLHHSLLFPTANKRSLNIQAIIEQWVKHGFSGNKLFLGVAFFARTFMMENTYSIDPKPETLQLGFPGQITKRKGLLSYSEVCQLRSPEKTVNGVDGPYVISNTLWAGYDNQQSVSLKVKWAIKNGLGGVSAWSVDFDDFTGKFCGQGPFPLLLAINIAWQSMLKTFFSSSENQGLSQHKNGINRSVQPVDFSLLASKPFLSRQNMKGSLQSVNFSQLKGSPISQIEQKTNGTIHTMDFSLLKGKSISPYNKSNNNPVKISKLKKKSQYGQNDNGPVHTVDFSLLKKISVSLNSKNVKGNVSFSNLKRKPESLKSQNVNGSVHTVDFDLLQIRPGSQKNTVQSMDSLMLKGKSQNIDGSIHTVDVSLLKRRQGSLRSQAENGSLHTVDFSLLKRLQSPKSSYNEQGITGFKQTNGKSGSFNEPVHTADFSLVKGRLKTQFEQNANQSRDISKIKGKSRSQYKKTTDGLVHAVDFSLLKGNISPTDPKTKTSVHTVDFSMLKRQLISPSENKLKTSVHTVDFSVLERQPVLTTKNKVKTSIHTSDFSMLKRQPVPTSKKKVKTSVHTVDFSMFEREPVVPPEHKVNTSIHTADFSMLINQPVSTPKHKVKTSVHTVDFSMLMKEPLPATTKDQMTTIKPSTIITSITTITSPTPTTTTTTTNPQTTTKATTTTTTTRQLKVPTCMLSREDPTTIKAQATKYETRGIRLAAILKTTKSLRLVTEQKKVSRLLQFCKGMEDDFYNHWNKCNKYVLCINGSIFVGTCIQSFKFNLENIMCEEDTTKTCIDSQELSILTTFPPMLNLSATKEMLFKDFCIGKHNDYYTHPVSCNFYVLCVKEEYFLGHCQPGYYFNPKLKICDESREKSCVDISEETNKEIKERIDRPTFERKCEGIKNEKYPHPNRCNLFILCLSQRMFIGKCQKEEYFSPELRMCVPFTRLECKDKEDPPALINPSYVMIVEFSNAFITPISLDDKCKGIKDGEYIHPTKCDFFILCFNQQMFIGKCPGDSLFSAITRTCEAAPSVDCSVDRYLRGSSIRNNEKPGKVSLASGQYPTLDGNCEQIPDGEYPHPTHCDRFILCFNQKMLLGICPKGNMFSMKTKQCVHPEKSDCKVITPNKDLVKQLTFDGKCNSIENGQYPHPTQCTMFLLCIQEKMLLGICPGGRLFSKMYQRCEEPTKVNCDDKSDKTIIDLAQWDSLALIQNIHIVVPTLNVELPSIILHSKLNLKKFCLLKDDGLYQHPHNCHDFIQCSNWRTFIKHCPEKLIFSIQIQQCVYSYNGNCSAGKQLTISDDDLREKHLPSKHDPHVDIRKKNLTSEKFQDFRFPTLYGNCENMKNGFYPHYADCSRFFLCSNQQMFIGICPQGKMFSMETKICENSKTVQCKGDVFPSLNAQTNTKWKITEEIKRQLLSISQQTHVIIVEFQNSFRRKHLVVDGTCKGIKNGEYRHPSECGLFTICFNQQMFIGKCPGNKLFSLKSRLCEHPVKVDCYDYLTDTVLDSSVLIYKNHSSTEKYPVLDGNCQGIQDGEHPHPNRCDQFILCHNQHMYIGICPKGSFFSNTLKMCDYSTNLDCQYPISNKGKTTFDRISKQRILDGHCHSIENGKYLHPSKCSMFILCFNQRLFVGVCPSGHNFSSKSGMCEYSPMVDCNDSYQSDSDQYQWKNFLISKNIYVIVPTLNRFVSSWLDQTKSTILSECIYKEDGLYSHPQHCDSFIQCNEWQTFIKICPNNLHFNSNTKQCDYPNKVKCTVKDSFHLAATDDYNIINVKTPRQYSPDSNILKRQQFPEKNDESSQKYPTLQGQCQGVADGEYPHPYKCNQFILCFNQQMFFGNCPQGTQFSFTSRFCDHKENINCTNQLTDKNTDEINEAETPSNTSKKLQFSSVPEILVKPSAKQPTLEGNCQDIRDGEYQHPTKCGLFILCFQQQLFIGKCPGDMLFSTELNSCTNPFGVNCEAKNRFEEKTSTTQASFTADKSSIRQLTLDGNCKDLKDGEYSHPTKCALFILCFNESMYLGKCHNGTFFSARTKMCDIPMNVDCEGRLLDEPSTIEVEQELTAHINKSKNVHMELKNVHMESKFKGKCIAADDGQYPHPTQCTIFILCFNQKAFLGICPGGRLFSSKTRMCDDPANVNCIIDSTKSAKQNISTEKNSSVVVPNLIGSRHSDEMSFSGKFPDQSLCLFKEDGIYKHPYQCNLFLQCSNWQTFIKICPEKLIFNSKINRCDYSHNVVCPGERHNKREKYALTMFGNQPFISGMDGSHLPINQPSVSNGKLPIQPESDTLPGHQPILPRFDSFNTPDNQPFIPGMDGSHLPINQPSVSNGKLPIQPESDTLPGHQPILPRFDSFNTPDNQPFISGMDGSHLPINQPSVSNGKLPIQPESDTLPGHQPILPRFDSFNTPDNQPFIPGMDGSHLPINQPSVSNGKLPIQPESDTLPGHQPILPRFDSFNTPDNQPFISGMDGSHLPINQPSVSNGKLPIQPESDTLPGHQPILPRFDSFNTPDNQPFIPGMDGSHLPINQPSVSNGKLPIQPESDTLPGHQPILPRFDSFNTPDNQPFISGMDGSHLPINQPSVSNGKLPGMDGSPESLGVFIPEKHWIVPGIESFPVHEKLPILPEKYIPLVTNKPSILSGIDEYSFATTLHPISNEYKSSEKYPTIEDNDKTNRLVQVQDLKSTQLFHGICRGILDGEYPHPSQCDLFILCFNQQAFIGKCHKGRLFSLTSRNCIDPVTVDCTGRDSILSLFPKQIFGKKSVQELRKPYILGINNFATPIHRSVPVTDPSIKSTRLNIRVRKPGTQSYWIRRYLQRFGNRERHITRSRIQPWLYPLTSNQPHFVFAPELKDTENMNQSPLAILQKNLKKIRNSGRKDLENGIPAWVYALMKSPQWGKLSHNQTYIYDKNRPMVYTLLKKIKDKIAANIPKNNSTGEPIALINGLIRNLQRGNNLYGSINVENQTKQWISELTKNLQNGTVIRERKNIEEKTQPWRFLIKNSQWSPKVSELKNIQQRIQAFLNNLNNKASHQNKGHIYDPQVLMTNLQNFQISPKSDSMILHIPKAQNQRILWIENLVKDFQSQIQLRNESVLQNRLPTYKRKTTRKERKLNNDLKRMLYSVIFDQNGQRSALRHSTDGTGWIVSSMSAHQIQGTSPINYCAGIQDGIYIYPSKCNRFVLCSNGKTFLESCPAGLLFNPILKRCDHLQNVSCIDQRPLQKVNQSFSADTSSSK